jgi:hypothetical protein
VSNIKTVKPNTSWVITDEKDISKLGSIVKEQGDKYLLKYQGFNRSISKEDLIMRFGTQMFVVPEGKQFISNHFVYDYPVDVEKPFNKMYYVKKKVPIYTKEKKSKSFYCAGHYLVYKKTWSILFCPKLITLEKYKFNGPFETIYEANAFKKRYL